MVPKNHVLLQTRESEVLAQSATVRVPDVQDSLRKRPSEDLWPTTSEGVQGEMWDCVLLRQVSKCIGAPKPPSCGHLYSGAPCSSAVKSTTENLQTDQEAADPEWSNGCADTLRVNMIVITKINQNSKLRLLFSIASKQNYETSLYEI